MSHFIERCRSCHIVTSQCRCPSSEKSQTFTVCKACVEKGLPYTNCTICLGEKPGVRGNEVVHNGVVMCDYCFIAETKKPTQNNKEWKWSEDSKCYYMAEFHTPPKCYCLGERYVYAHYGVDSYGILYRGSTIDNWGGWNFGYDLKKAIDWIQQAEQPELGHSKWTASGGAI